MYYFSHVILYVGQPYLSF